MKKIIVFIFLLLIAYSLCQNDDEYNENDVYDECESSTDRSNCQNIKINDDGWSCYPIIDESYPESYCTAVNDNFFSDLKLFYQIQNGIKKEFESAYADYIDEENKNGQSLDLYQLGKDSYTKGETIEIKKIEPSAEDIEILNSKQTCIYYFYARFYGKALTEYPDITDKDTCFNAKQFSDLNGIIECGYATITFTTSYDKYTIKTCYFYEGDDLPSEYTDLIGQYFYTDDFDDPEHGGFLAFTFYLLDYAKHPEKYGYDDNDDERRRRRRLAEVQVDISVENKNGKEYKYSVGNGNYDNNNKSSKAVYYEINYIILILFLLLS